MHTVSLIGRLSLILHSKCLFLTKQADDRGHPWNHYSLKNAQINRSRNLTKQYAKGSAGLPEAGVTLFPWSRMRLLTPELLISNNSFHYFQSYLAENLSNLHSAKHHLYSIIFLFSLHTYYDRKLDNPQQVCMSNMHWMCFNIHWQQHCFHGKGSKCLREVSTNKPTKPGTIRHQ